MRAVAAVRNAFKYDIRGVIWKLTALVFLIILLVRWDSIDWKPGDTFILLLFIAVMSFISALFLTVIGTIIGWILGRVLPRRTQDWLIRRD
jgi:hypothetical protein